MYFMCSTGRITVKCLDICELSYVVYMLAYASVLHLTICRITWSLWCGTRGLTKLGLKFVSSLVKHGMYISGEISGANVGIFLGINIWSISPLYITFRFDTCMEHLNICRMHF